MRGQEGVAQVVLVGVEGQAGDWRVVGPHEDVLHVFCVKGGVLWLVLMTLTKPVEQPAAI